MRMVNAASNILGEQVPEAPGEWDSWLKAHERELPPQIDAESIPVAPITSWSK
jgi:hypothetical protein